MQGIANHLSTMIKTFSDFLTEAKGPTDAAGVAVIYDKKILLVHPANGSWVRPIMGIPKGGVEPGEELIDAAIRELHEETGIKVSPAQLEPQVQTVEIFNKVGKYQHSLHYFVCRIQDLSEIGLEGLSVPKTQLQKEEVDWAGFIELAKAYPKVSRAQLIILDRLS